MPELKKEEGETEFFVKKKKKEVCVCVCMYVCACVCVCDGLLRKGPSGYRESAKQKSGGGGKFGRVGNHSLRVLYRLFLVFFHLSR